MITIQGKGVSKGIAKGPLYFFQRSDTTVTLKVVSDIEAEKARLAVAQEQSIRQLNALAEQCQEDAVRRWQPSLKPMPCLWKMKTL